MLARRNLGTVKFHQALIAVEAAALWALLANFIFTFPSSLPAFAYPLALAFGVLLATENRYDLLQNSGSGSFLDATRLALRQVAFGCGAVFSLIVMFKDPGMSRAFLLLFFTLLFPLLVLLNRNQPRWIAWRFLFSHKKMPTLLVGGTQRFPHFSRWLTESGRLGVEPVGCLAYHGEHAEDPRLPYLGTIEDLELIMAEQEIGQVIMLDQPENTRDAERVLRACLAHGSRLLIHNNFGYKLGFPLQSIQENHYNFLTLNDEPLEEPLNRGLKRAMDIVISLAVLFVVFPPLALAVAIAQKLQSPGPLFFAQLRTGRNRTRFTILKFRSMHAANDDEARQARPGDTRIFPFGAFLRRTSLDEIPQFINVLRGEMSTVGPRPHLLAHSDAFSRDVDTYYLRYFAKPGITGLAQCNGFRGDTSSPEMLRGRVQLDLEYIRKWSLAMDFWIMIKTARQVLFPPRTAV